jgi:hypothetical protein
MKNNTKKGKDSSETKRSFDPSSEFFENIPAPPSSINPLFWAAFHAEFNIAQSGGCFEI